MKLSPRVRMSLLCAVALMFTAFTHAMGARSQSDLCGTTLLENLTLDHDMVCVGNGLIVGADDITVNLNGHTITGSGIGMGIRIAGRADITVKGGTVQNFETGVMVANSFRVVIKNNDFTGTREGVFLSGSTDCVVKDNRAWLNLMRGIMIRPSSTNTSTGNRVVENTLSDNPVGILLFGQPDNSIVDNTITGSSLAGILLTGGGASGNEFKGNAISTSAAAIQFGPGWVGNWFAANRLTFNTCGLQGVTAGNLFSETFFANNTIDTCP